MKRYINFTGGSENVNFLKILSNIYVLFCSKLMSGQLNIDSNSCVYISQLPGFPRACISLMSLTSTQRSPSLMSLTSTQRSPSLMSLASTQRSPSLMSLTSTQQSP